METKPIPATVIFILSLIISSCASSFKPSGPIIDEIIDETFITEVQPWEDGLRTDPTGNSFEWWYFDASFNDGSTAVIVFSTKNILNPREKADPNVSIIITTPDGDKITVDDSPGIDGFKASTESLDVKVSNSYAIGNLSRCFIHFEKDGIEADLTFISRAPSWRPGSGKMYFDSEKEKYFAWLPAIPFGDVKGSLKYDGKEIKVIGTGYHDHNWGNVRLDKVMTQWYWGRARIDDYTLIFSRMLTSPKYGSIRVPVFYLAKGNEILSSREFDFTFTPSKWLRHSGGRDYPEEITMNVVQKDMQTKINITDPVFIEARDLLENQPWLVKNLSSLFINPYYFRFNADFHLRIENSTHTVEKSGNGIFEMMLLREKQTIHQ
ncbi:MAG: hypothetical protein KAR21_19475 [Spirochaetales bacterium]|nr:hypothetical protein [Spirochaetales bacterium]